MPKENTSDFYVKTLPRTDVTTSGEAYSKVYFG